LFGLPGKKAIFGWLGIFTIGNTNHMIPLPLVYCVYGTDAPQHLGKVQTLMSQFKADNRIEDFFPLEIDNALAISERFKANDIIVLLLTVELNKKRKDIASLIVNIESKFPGSIIVEIIIDNVPFENRYITLPQNLRPIRDVQDMDLAWNDIEARLKQILPAYKTQKKPQLSKYIKYLILIIVLLILMIWRPWS